MVETEKETGKKHRSRVTPTEGEDIYVGTLATNGKANGNGKYLWCDGCMYSGHWDNGKANGNGKFSWPSGATYEGQFLDGKMDGKGTFTGVNGETYKGNWVGGVREGEGEKWYSNGDYYSGGWRDDAIDGVGKYVWSNGDWYKGEWRKDEICGKGVIVWKDGKRVEGVWVNGQCQMVSGSGLGRVCPKVCVWDCERESGDITCDIVDGIVDNKKVFCKKDCEFVKGDVMKSGEIICKGDKNYDLMICFQLGISFSLEKYSLIARELRSSDFDPMAKFWTKFPPEGSKLTPSHKSTDFRWKDYCPMVFKNLRNLFKVDPSDYMLSICGNDGLRELSSPGKSGSFFYLTQNERFMIKTVKKSEVKVLLRMLTTYYKHVRRHENSLLTKFYGMHCVKPVGGPKTRFIVMGNLFSSKCRIHRRFDLKGSRHGRTVEKTEGEIDETTTLKDLDLDFVFRLESNWYQKLIKQIERDCEFLEAERIMDYSLLIGIHFRNEKSGDTIGLPPFILRGKEGSYPNKLNLRGQRSLEAELQDIDRVLDARVRLGSNMPAKAERLTRKSNADKYIPGGYGNLSFSRNGEVYEVILYFGIIDILQDYVMSKRLERAYKSLQVDPNSISAVDPKLYSKRFRDFIGTIFAED